MYDDNIFVKIWNYLRGEGISDAVSARAVDLTAEYLEGWARYQKDGLLLDAPQGNPWAEILDEALGEPLRAFKKLADQMRAEIAVVTHAVNIEKLAHVSVMADRAVESLKGQQVQLDRLQSEISSQPTGGAALRVIGPPEIYTRMEEAKRERRQRYRALW